MLSVILFTLQLWSAFPTTGTEILHGSWQSCRDEHGVYGERIYDRREHGKWVWSFHMGPYHDFALYMPANEPTGGNDGEHYHSGPENLLAPAYTVDSGYARGNRIWVVPALHLWVNVVQAGGSREECESYVVLIRRQP